MFQSGTFHQTFYFINKDCNDIFIRLFHKYRNRLEHLIQEIIIIVFSHHNLIQEVDDIYANIMKQNIIKIFEELELISYLYLDD